mgnify:CR=1 FL=1
MVIGSGKQKWPNAVGFAGSLVAVTNVELSGFCSDKLCHAESWRSLCRCEWGPEGLAGGVRVL